MASSVKVHIIQVGQLRKGKICHPEGTEFASLIGLPQENRLSRPDVVTGLATCAYSATTIMVANLNTTGFAITRGT